MKYNYKEWSYKALVDILENEKINREMEKSIYYMLLALKCDIESIIRQEAKYKFKNIKLRVDKENNEILMKTLFSKYNNIIK